MRKLNRLEISECHGGWKWKKFYINPVQLIFTGIGAFLIGGPVSAGIVVGTMLATEGGSQAINMAFNWNE
jgi:hypothetical protein